MRNYNHAIETFHQRQPTAIGQPILAYEQLLYQGGERMRREASAYFAGRGALHDALYRLTRGLYAASIGRIHNLG